MRRFFLLSTVLGLAAVFGLLMPRSRHNKLRTPSPRASFRALVVRRTPDKSRETPEAVELRSARGVPGDAWDRQPNGNPEAGKPEGEVQASGAGADDEN